MQHLFGIDVCQNCPDCNIVIQPCQDLLGGNATPEGGILGRVDAVSAPVEAQTSAGSLHSHSQVFVQCLHQHTYLWLTFYTNVVVNPEI